MRVVKTSLFNIVKDRILTNFQMITVFTEVENMINNRPVTAKSEKSWNLEVVKIYPLEECYVDEVPQGGGNDTESNSDSTSRKGIVINHRVAC